MAADVLYHVTSVQQRYGARLVLDVENLEIRRGESLAIIGPSGAGKSTLLRLLQFLETPTTGFIVFDGRRINGTPPLEQVRRITTVFQRPLLLDRSVRGNVAFGLRVRGRADQRPIVDRLLDALALGPLADVSARRLSGGEIQRVAVARALAVNPDVLLLDEPTANLDPRNVRLVEDLVNERRARGVTIVLVAHQVFQARRLADRTALLLDGRIVEMGPTLRVLDAPSDPRTRAFLHGKMVY
jgi:tungstate transport system ATP-binding protein